MRAAAPGVPIGVALDLHGNITEKMVRNADVMVGFKTYPHVDMYETGEHAGRLLLAMLAGEAKYAVCWRQLPLMSHTLRSTTLGGAMQRAVQAARAAEAEGIPAVSVFAGFSLADIEAPCVSVVVTGYDTPEGMKAAQAAADRVAAQIWEERAGFVYESESLADSLARARSLPKARLARAAARSRRQLHVRRHLRHDGRAGGCAASAGCRTSRSAPCATRRPSLRWCRPASARRSR